MLPINFAFISLCLGGALGQLGGGGDSSFETVLAYVQRGTNPTGNNGKEWPASLSPSAEKIMRTTGGFHFVRCTSTSPLGSGLRVDWMNPEGEKIGVDKKNRIYVDNSHGHHLFMDKLSPADSGTYTCHTHSGKKSFELTVEDAITIDHGLYAQTATEGDVTYSMKCPATGVRDPYLSWTVDGKGVYSWVRNPKHGVTQEGYLIIRNVSLTDGQRLYTCRTVYMDPRMYAHIQPPGFRYMNVTLVVLGKPTLPPNPIAYQANTTNLRHNTTTAASTGEGSVGTNVEPSLIEILTWAKGFFHGLHFFD